MGDLVPALAYRWWTQNYSVVWGLENHRKSLYCFSKYSPLRSNTLLHAKQICHFDWGISKTWTHRPLLRVSKNVDFSFYFLRTGIKRSHSVLRHHQINVLSAQKCSCLSRCVRARIIRSEEWSVVVYHSELTALF